MMNKLVFLAILALSISGCPARPWATRFVVVNKSDTAIVVSQKYKEFPEFAMKQRNPTREDLIYKPQAVDVSLLSRSLIQWHDIPSKLWNFDAAQMQLSLEVAPNQAIVVDKIWLYRDTMKNKYSAGSSEKISIRGPQGEFAASGDQVIKAFARVNRELFVLEYK